ncbi:MAG: hypothetical protein ACD_30C00039G0022 [uncultured bacterium]|uniref:Uncharacterized protein n=4 Tax=Candidatus Daviesiibacteriota TaxID=1752718 RepID=A0A0G0ENG7_9BACT|nr:MAG: hypothetical protein ACD_30C00039G0022 [uncultured bacterium]KKQ08563.1 MAG: hypothetical protein US19_C0022G0024 [Candidatus Daviesbacteria bacterium GW2011_GWB1_36_5]KKQ15047.1 MAG: hypothetical protein US28_C0024G0004 [Candidatus Daviesbacteria bacterium GW2011_GWA1_36_8]OGE17119.1 MAG: hypothetical protein A2858_00235 [Candidatus Daviesbacteria bacterium RIFCSPHIGHO2_01_FULL_36_37]OGE35900.1 MAG: hypothetical protein A3E66_01230 [Candidatus Daviesbacteria bacterium RIFCSPHIGHO2_12_F
MPRLSGVFDIFADLERIPISDIASWLKQRGDLHTLQNSIGNRLLYPQVVPLTKEDLNIDLAILREAVFRQPEKIYSPKEQKIVIPENFLTRFPPLINLVIALLQALNPQGITTLNIKNIGVTKLIGSSVAPPFNGVVDNLSLEVNGTNIGQLKPGGVMLFPYKDKHLRIKIGQSLEGIAPGGDLGLIIDLRKWA